MSVFLTKIRPDSSPETVAAAVQSVVPGAQIVRTTAVSTTRYTGRATTRYVALALDGQHESLPIPPGRTYELVRLLQRAYPSAEWSGTCTWRAGCGLVRLQPRRPRRGGGHPYAAA